jgi:hypothetical protein
MSGTEHGMEHAPRGSAARRHFTIPEADRALILVKRIVADIVREYHRLLDLQENVDLAEAARQFPQADALRSRLAESAEKLRLYLEELDEVGVTLRDWSVGIVDFPSVVDGREVQLCWQCGEPRVSFWHDANSGNRGRQPLSTLLVDKALAT